MVTIDRKSSPDLLLIELLIELRTEKLIELMVELLSRPNC